MLGALGLALLLGLCGLYYLGAALEARSYRKFCDTPVTAFDALWLDLRIDECEAPE
jgi:hypothetical protein